MLSRHPREDSVATRMDSFLAWCIFPRIFTGDGSSNIYIYICTYENSLENSFNMGGRNFLAVGILLYRFFFFVGERKE